MLVKYNARSPTNKDNGITKPFPFNLMFKTTIGPEGNSVGFLRPETAQGLFVNFRYVLLSFHILLLLLLYHHIHHYYYYYEAHPRISFLLNRTDIP